MKRRIASLLLALCCTTTPLAAQDLPTLKVGVIIPLSGSLATYGAACRNGIELAIKEDPEKFSQIRFLFEDSQYDARKTISAFQKLREVDKVNMLYVWGVTPSATLEPLVGRHKIPTVAVTTDPSLNKKNPWLILQLADLKQIGSVLAKHLIKSGAHSIAIITANLPFYLSMVHELRAAAANNLDTTFIEEVNPDQIDFKAVVAKLRQRSADAVGVFLMPGQISQWYRQSSDQGIRIPTFGTEDLSTKSEIDAIPHLLEGATYPAQYVEESFAQKYRGYVGNDFHLSTAGNGYEFARYLPQIVSQSSTIGIDRSLILETFNKVQFSAGSLGTPTHLKNPPAGLIVSYPIIMREIKSGRAVDIK